MAKLRMIRFDVGEAVAVETAKPPRIVEHAPEVDRRRHNVARFRHELFEQVVGQYEIAFTPQHTIATGLQRLLNGDIAEHRPLCHAVSEVRHRFDVHLGQMNTRVVTRPRLQARVAVVGRVAFDEREDEVDVFARLRTGDRAKVIEVSCAVSKERADRDRLRPRRPRPPRLGR